MNTRSVARSLYLSVAVLFVLLAASGASAQSQAAKPTLAHLPSVTVPCGQSQVIYQHTFAPGPTAGYVFDVTGHGAGWVLGYAHAPNWADRDTHIFSLTADVYTQFDVISPRPMPTEPQVVGVVAYAVPCAINPAGLTVTALTVTRAP